MNGGACVVHAYGVVPLSALDADPPVVPESGIGGSPVRLLPLSGLAVVVGDLDAERFGEAAWREHAEDPAWLEPVARGHHDVLRAVAAVTDVLPLRLPGIYPDDEALVRLLGLDQERLQERLGFVSGHDEWGVQVFGGSRTDSSDTQEASSGRDYLMRRKAAAQDKEEARARRQALVAEVYEALTEASTSSVLNRPQDRALSGRDEPMLLNSAHLVPRQSRDDFFACADELTQRVLEPAALVMEISGPWPPYNFAAPVSSTPAAEARQ